MRYFLTGGGSSIGRALARSLRADGHHVTTFVARPETAVELEQLGCETWVADPRDRAAVSRAMTDCDGVFHTVSSHPLDPADTRAQSIDVEGTRTVLCTMKALNIPRGVLTSSLAVFSNTHGRVVDETYRYDGPVPCEHERLRRTIHYDIALPMIDDGLPLVIVMPSMVYGPDDTSTIGRLFVRYLEGRAKVLPRDAVYCWGHVDDIARGHRLAMDRGRPSETYVMAGPRHSVVEVFDLAEHCTGIRAPRLRVGARPMHALASLSDWVEGRLLPRRSLPKSEILRLFAGTTYTASSAKAERELGFSARSLERGLSQTLEALARQLRDSPHTDRPRSRFVPRRRRSSPGGCNPMDEDASRPAK